jgi:hypothetical protein
MYHRQFYNRYFIDNSFVISAFFFCRGRRPRRLSQMKDDEEINDCLLAVTSSSLHKILRKKSQPKIKNEKGEDEMTVRNQA